MKTFRRLMLKTETNVDTLPTTVDLFKRLWDCPDPAHPANSSYLGYYDEYGELQNIILDCNCTEVTYSSLDPDTTQGITTAGC